MFWNIILGIASFALSLLLSPKPQNAKPASLDDFGIPTAEEGLEIPVAFGSVWIYPNTVWYGDLQLQPIKGPRRYGFFGPRATLGWRYGLGMHLVLCHSSHDKIFEIWAEKKLYPKGTSTVPFEGAGVLFIDQMDIYGGDEGAGGVFGFVGVLTGEASQGVDSYLAGVMGAGANTPAFRGVVSLVWQRLYIGNSPYIKPWKIYLQRIHKTATGAEQWYDAKAAVPDTPSGTTVTGTSFDTISNLSYRGFDTYGDWAAIGSGNTAYVFGVTDGSMRTFTYSGYLALGGHLFITSDEEIITRRGGNAFGGSDTFLDFRDLTDPDLGLTQSIDLSPYDPGVQLNSGFNASEITIGGTKYIFFQIEPFVAFRGPYLLLSKDSGDPTWSVDSSGLSDGTTIGAYQGISLGTQYAYLRDDTTVGLVDWTSGFAESSVSPPSIGGREIRTVTYLQSTDEVLIVYNDGWAMVYDAAITTVIRSNQILASSLLNTKRGLDNRLLVSGSQAAIVQTDGLSRIVAVHMVNLATLEISRTVAVYPSSAYVNRTLPYLYAAFNQSSGAMFVGPSGNPRLFSIWPMGEDGRNMNPSHIIRECLTDRTWGMGYADADIDDDSFTAAADTLYDECFGLSLLWTREQPLDEFISMILSHIDAYLYLRRDTGKFFLKLVRNDYDPDAIPQFTEADVVSWDEVTHRGPPEAINTVTVKWTDKSNQGKDAAVSYDNIAQIQQIGSRIPATRFYPGITYGPLAASVARRDQRTLGVGLINGRLTGHRTFDSLYPGDPFRLVSARQNLDGEVMRVAEMTFGDGRKNAIGVKFLQDIFRMNLEDIIDTSGSDWENPITDPEAVEPRLVWEAPYFEANQMLGPTDLTSMLTADPDAGIIEVAGAQPSGSSLQADIYVDNVDTDEALALWAPAGTLDADLGGAPTDDSITITDEFDETAIEVGMLAALVDPDDPGDPTTTEIVRIDAIASLTLTISRGMLDTVPTEHPAGTWLVVFHDFVATDGVKRTAGDTPEVALVTRTASAILSGAPTDEITLASRAIRPLRPADTQIDGIGSGTVDATALNPIPTSWARRNRLTETVPLAWDDADVTPEGSQTTTLRLLDGGGTLIDDTTYTGIAGTTQDVDPADFGGALSGFIEFVSVRDGYTSWQNYRIALLVSSADLLLEGDETGSLLLEGDESGSLLLEGSL